MNRRTFLATTGAVGMAGCLATGPGSPAPGTATPSTTPSPPDRITSAWPVPGHDAGRSNYAPAATGPVTRPAELWAHSAGTALSAPVVADGSVYVGGDDGVVRALDARTGEPQWRTPVGASARTPHVVGGRLVVPTADEIVALGMDGEGPQWQVPTGPRRGFVAASHGLYYVATGEEAAVVALARADGSQRWRASIQDPWKPPVFAGAGQVFVTTRGSWDTPWRFDAETGAFRGERRPPSGGADFVVSQCYRGGAVFGATEMFSTVTATPVADDGHSWRTRVDDAACFELAAGPESLFAHGKCNDRKGLFALSLADGSEEWYTDAVTDAASRPIATSETVLVPTERELVCVAASDGAERWRRPADDVGARVAVVDDVLVTTEGDTVRALR